MKLLKSKFGEVLGLPGATTATTLAISHLDIATEMILHFVQSRKWKSISVAFQWWEPQEADPDPSLRDFLEVATRQTASLAVAFLSIPHVMHAIGPVLEEEGTNIQELDFSNCRFCREEALALASGLRSHQTLRKLTLWECDFQEDSLQQLAASLNHRLEEIELGLFEDSNDSDPTAILSAFISSIPFKRCPRRLAITYQRTLNDDGAWEGPLVALGILLSRKDCDLEDLLLSMDAPDCKARAFEHFAQGLGTSHSLRKLTLGEFTLSDDLAGSLADAFQQHSALREVDIRYVKLTDRGVKRIGKALLAMPNLKVAHISRNNHPITSTKTADLLVKLMKENYSLEEFRVGESSPEVQNRLDNVDIYCALNRAGRQSYVNRPFDGASKGLEIELAILEKVNTMELSANSAYTTLRASALYKSVRMMAESFAAIPN